MTFEAMKKTTPSQDAESSDDRPPADTPTSTNGSGRRIWPRRGNYWEALLRFKEVLEREQAQIIAEPQTPTEQPPDKTNVKVEHCDSKENPPRNRRGRSSRCFRRLRLSCCWTKR